MNKKNKYNNQYNGYRKSNYVRKCSCTYNHQNRNRSCERCNLKDNKQKIKKIVVKVVDKKTKVLQEQLDNLVKENSIMKDKLQIHEEDHKEFQKELKTLKQDSKKHSKDIEQNAIKIDQNKKDLEEEKENRIKENKSMHKKLDKIDDKITEFMGNTYNFMKSLTQANNINKVVETPVNNLSFATIDVSRSRSLSRIKNNTSREEVVVINKDLQKTFSSSKEWDKTKVKDMKEYIKTHNENNNENHQIKYETKMLKANIIKLLIESNITPEMISNQIYKNFETGEVMNLESKQQLETPSLKANEITNIIIKNTIKQFLENNIPSNIKKWLKNSIINEESFLQKDICYVWCINSKIKYIGSTTRSVEQRIKEHIQKVLLYKKGSKSNSIQSIHKAILSQGIKNWICIPFQKGSGANRLDGKSEILQLERKLIKRWNPKYNTIKKKPTVKPIKKKTWTIKTRSMTKAKQINQQKEKENLSIWINTQNDFKAYNLVNIIGKLKNNKELQIKGKKGIVDITNWQKLFQYRNLIWKYNNEVVELKTIKKLFNKENEINFTILHANKQIEFKIPKQIRKVQRLSKKEIKKVENKNLILEAWSLLNKIKNKKLREIETKKVETVMKINKCYIPKIVAIKIPYNEQITKKEIKYIVKENIKNLNKNPKIFNKIVRRIRVIFTNHKNLGKLFHNHIKTAKEFKEDEIGKIECQCDKNKHYTLRGTELKSIKILKKHPKYIPSIPSKFNLKNNLNNQLNKLLIKLGGKETELNEKSLYKKDNPKTIKIKKQIFKGKNIQKKKEWIIGPIDKNAGGNFISCKKLYNMQLIEAFHYLDTKRNFIKLEKNEEDVYISWKKDYNNNEEWKKIGKWKETKKIGYGYIIPKEKDLYKTRPIVSYFSHPMKDLLNKTARGLIYLIQKYGGENWNLWKATEAPRLIMKLWNEKEKEEKWILKTFDIKEMFTNLNKKSIIESIDWIFKQIPKRVKYINVSNNKKGDKPRKGKSYAVDRTNFPIETLKEIILFDLENSIFRVGDLTLKQKKGIPMGSPISPVLAQLACIYRENKYMKENNEKIADFKAIRYMDDLLFMIKDNKKEILEDINLIYFNSLKLEEEDTATKPNEEVKFLSVRISSDEKGICRIRSNVKNEINFQNKKKPTNRFIDYDSKMDNKIKIALIVGEMHRLEKENNNWEDKIYSILWLWIELRKAKFPKKKIIKGMNIANNKLAKDLEDLKKRESIIKLTKEAEKVKFGAQTHEKIRKLSKIF